MKLKIISLSLFVFIAVSAVNGQTADEPRKHNFSLGPIAGYNLAPLGGNNNETKGLNYGAGLMYEYRPFQKFGFTAGLTYERMKTDVSDHFYGDIGGLPVYGDVWIHQAYSFSAGARYYMDGFYLGGALGLGLDKGHTTLSDGNTLDGGHAYGLYKSLAAGYQIPLKNRDAIEVEAGFFGTKGMKIGGTVRYKFRR
jgi:hypothetical protein